MSYLNDKIEEHEQYSIDLLFSVNSPNRWHKMKLQFYLFVNEWFSQNLLTIK